MIAVGLSFSREFVDAPSRQTHKKMEKAEEIMARYRNTLHVLAK